MYNFRISIFYKQQPLNPTAADLLNAATLRPGDLYSQVFTDVIQFSNSSDETILQETFAIFNGQGNPLPTCINLPRSMSVGDIISGEETLAFLVTETGFQRLAFAPRGKEFKITQSLLSRKLPDEINKLSHPLRPGEA